MNIVYVIIVDRSNYASEFNPVVAAFVSKELAERYLDEEMYERLIDKNGDAYWVDTYNCKYKIIDILLRDHYYNE